MRVFGFCLRSVHRNEILAAAIHEYTDWERPVQHPISVRDETLDALADAQVCRPFCYVFTDLLFILISRVNKYVPKHVPS